MIKHKVLSLVLILVLSPVFVHGQTKQGIEEEFTKYMEFLEAKDFASTMDYLPNALFEQVPRDQLLEAMEASLNNPMLEISFKNSMIHGIEDIFEINAIPYALLEYSTEMDMKYVNTPGDSELLYVQSALETQFGKESVSLNKESSTFTISSQKKICSIYEDERWKFIEYDEKQPQMAEMILPGEVLSKLKDQ